MPAPTWHPALLQVPNSSLKPRVRVQPQQDDADASHVADLILAQTNAQQVVDLEADANKKQMHHQKASKPLHQSVVQYSPAESKHGHSKKDRKHSHHCCCPIFRRPEHVFHQPIHNLLYPRTLPACKCSTNGDPKAHHMSRKRHPKQESSGATRDLFCSLTHQIPPTVSVHGQC